MVNPISYPMRQNHAWKVQQRFRFLDSNFLHAVSMQEKGQSMTSLLPWVQRVSCFCCVVGKEGEGSWRRSLRSKGGCQAPVKMGAADVSIWAELPKAYVKLTTSSSSAPHQSNMEIYLQNFKMTWAFQMTRVMFGGSLQQLKIGGRMWRALHTLRMSCRARNYLGLSHRGLAQQLQRKVTRHGAKSSRWLSDRKLFQHCWL